MNFRIIFPIVFFGAMSVSNSLAEKDPEAEKMASLMKAPYVFLVDIDERGNAKVTNTIRSKEGARGKAISQRIEKMQWPQNAKRKVLVFRYEGEEAISKSGVYPVKDQRFIQVGVLRLVDYEDLLREGKNEPHAPTNGEGRANLPKK